MLSFEWRELEALCDRLSDLRHRYAAAHRSRHVGLVEGLKAEIAKARRQRELLVHHISSRLAATGQRQHGAPDGQHQTGSPQHTGAGSAPKLAAREPLL
jgi:hypothetical protein